MQKSEPVFLAGERLTPETRRLSHSLASGLTLEHLPTTPLCLDISAETPNPSCHDRQIFFFNRITSLGILALHFIFLTIQRSCALVPLVLETTPHYYFSCSRREMLQYQFSHINPVLWFVQAGHGGLKARPFPWTFLRLGSKAWPGAELLCPGPWAAGWGRRAARLHPAQQHLSGHCLGCVSSYKLGTWHQLTPPIIWG